MPEVLSRMWAASRRNGGRLHVGRVGGIQLVHGCRRCRTAATFVKMSHSAQLQVRSVNIFSQD